MHQDLSFSQSHNYLTRSLFQKTIFSLVHNLFITVQIMKLLIHKRKFLNKLLKINKTRKVKAHKRIHKNKHYTSVPEVHDTDIFQKTPFLKEKRTLFTKTTNKTTELQ